MKKQIITTLILATLSQTIFAQIASFDSIFTSEGIILANVKKIAPDVVEYGFPDEEMVTSIYKNTVRKIRFKSGRVQMFTEAIALNTVNNAFDFESVNLTRLESETKGMIKIDEVASKAVGTTVFSNITTVKERAFRKLKIAAAMLGGNLLYMLDQSTVGNQVGGQYQSGKATETILTGLVYTDKLPKMEDFKALIKDKKSFPIYQAIYIGRNSTDIEEGSIMEKNLVIENLYEENRFIYINAKGFESVLLRVVSFDENRITLAWKDSDRSRIYNLFLKP
jgi:hypothetical protein